MRIYVTLPAGTENLAEQLLIKQYDIRNVVKTSGALVFDFNKNVKELCNLKIFNNIFIVVNEYNNLSYISIIKKLELSNNLTSIKNYVPRKKFRVKFSNNNQFEKVDTMFKVRAEKIISSSLGIKTDFFDAENEFWLIRKIDGWCCLAYLIRQEMVSEIKGELKSEIANLMCLISNIKKEDVVLDCFCGYGGIVKAALTFEPKMIYASDIETNLVNDLKGKLVKKNLLIFKSDVANINISEKIDKIITDAPWGEYNRKTNIDDLYLNFLTMAYKNLNKGGTVTALLSRDYNLQKFVNNLYAFDIKIKEDLLVNGKKATLYLLKKSMF